MRDPGEGRSETGMILTGASADRIAPAFGRVLDEAVADVTGIAPRAAVYVYGSVATGQAVVGPSDVDLLTIDLPADAAERLSTDLSRRFADRCRGVEIGDATSGDLWGDRDEAYGNRVFLRHYCVHLAGPDHRPDHDFPADVRAARGFNGDVTRHRDRWRAALAAGEDTATVARRSARKTLLAVAGLVSVHDGTWTTDRATAASRWAEVEPSTRHGLATLLRWVDDAVGVTPAGLGRMLDETVDPLLDRFAADIGLWH